MKNWWVILASLSAFGLRAEMDCQRFFEAIASDGLKADETTVFSMSYRYQNELNNCRDKDGNNAMHIFARSSTNFNIYSMLKYLVKIDLNALNNYNRTPLHEAVIAGNYIVLNWLLFLQEIRCTIDWRDSEQCTALEWARTKNNPKILKVLNESIRAGLIDERPASPLHVPASTPPGTPKMGEQNCGYISFYEIGTNHSIN